MTQLVINSASPQTLEAQASIYTGHAGASCSHMCQAETDLDNPVENLWDQLQEKCFLNKVLVSLGALEDDFVMGLLATESTSECGQFYHQLTLDYSFTIKVEIV